MRWCACSSASREEWVSRSWPLQRGIGPEAGRPMNHSKLSLCARLRFIVFRQDCDALCTKLIPPMTELVVEIPEVRPHQGISSGTHGATKRLDICAHEVWRKVKLIGVTGSMLALVYIYMWTASSGGVRDILYAAERRFHSNDIYAPRPEHYHLQLFEHMFFPHWVEAGRRGDQPPPRRSLVVFTSGASGVANVDSLVRKWGMEHFDYVICHFDESHAEWAKLDWYSRVVRFSANRQGKMWFFKRVITPWLVAPYEYVHFVDSDAGSPPEQPFDLWAYERTLLAHGVVLGQPAITDKVKSTVHDICKQHPGVLLRWTTFVENGPLFSIHVQDGAFKGLWEMVDSVAVSGYGVDMGWCPYLCEKKGFRLSRTCAIVDAHPIDHLDTHSATGRAYAGDRQYADFGNKEWVAYGRALGHLRNWQNPKVIQTVL